MAKRQNEPARQRCDSRWPTCRQTAQAAAEQGRRPTGRCRAKRGRPRREYRPGCRPGRGRVDDESRGTRRSAPASRGPPGQHSRWRTPPLCPSSSTGLRRAPLPGRRTPPLAFARVGRWRCASTRAWTDQLKTPWSMRPSSSMTAVKPSPLPRSDSGLFPPRAFEGVSSHRAPASSSSRTWRAFTSARATRMLLSASSEDSGWRLASRR